jgi:integrase
MATGKIAKRSVDALAAPPLGAQGKPAADFLWDEDLSGFGLRVTSNGAKSYVYQYRMGGREAAKKRVTIGKHGSPWTPDSARAEAKRLALLVGQGTDPMLADKVRRRETVTLAFASYAQRFTDEYLKTNWPRGWSLADGILRREAVPAFAGLSLPQITRGHVSEFLDGLADRPAVRRNAFAALRRLFRWAVSRGDIPASPITDMDAPTAPSARDRVLSDDELTAVWRASCDLDYPFGPMFRLLVATGQRREEVAALSWTELDQTSATWTLPAKRAKNRQAHIVPLSPIAIAVLDELALLLGSVEDGAPKWPRKGLVLSTTGKTAVSGFSKAKARLDRTMKDAEKKRAEVAGDEPEPIDPWRLHDLRRTVATGLQRLGVRFEVTEAVLNHVSGAKSGVAGVYQRHDWKDEKRVALEAWGRHLSALLKPADATNVAKLELKAA